MIKSSSYNQALGLSRGCSSGFSQDTEGSQSILTYLCPKGLLGSRVPCGYCRGWSASHLQLGRAAAQSQKVMGRAAVRSHRESQLLWKPGNVPQARAAGKGGRPKGSKNKLKATSKRARKVLASPKARDKGIQMTHQCIAHVTFALPKLALPSRFNELLFLEGPSIAVLLLWHLETTLSAQSEPPLSITFLIKAFFTL